MFKYEGCKFQKIWAEMKRVHAAEHIQDLDNLFSYFENLDAHKHVGAEGRWQGSQRRKCHFLLRNEPWAPLGSSRPGRLYDHLLAEQVRNLGQMLDF